MGVLEKSPFCVGGMDIFWNSWLGPSHLMASVLYKGVVQIEAPTGVTVQLQCLSPARGINELLERPDKMLRWERGRRQPVMD